MSKSLQFILDWSEVWALLIPLAVLLFRKKQPGIVTPVIIYLVSALALNLFADVIADFKKSMHFPDWLQSNNPIYNIHSVVRFGCFSYFFIILNQPSFRTIRNVLPFVSILFIIINFIFFEDFFFPDHLSGNLLSAEAYLLLVYCMLYYLAELREEDDISTNGPEFWIITGLALFVVVNFFVFLFYVPMMYEDRRMTSRMWNIHNVAYIIFCLFIAKAFYGTNRR
jgi:hypothetical protein